MSPTRLSLSRSSRDLVGSRACTPIRILCDPHHEAIDSLDKVGETITHVYKDEQDSGIAKSRSSYTSERGG